MKQAAGVERGAMESTKEVVGLLTRKHIYEIAKIKSQDQYWQMVDLQVSSDLNERIFNTIVDFDNRILTATTKIPVKFLF